jgi:YhcH/YjgK/YiaL family protein
MQRREVVLGLLAGGLMAKRVTGGEKAATTGLIAEWQASPLSRGFEPAFEYLASLDPKSVVEGRTALLGDDVYALASRYTTKAPETTRFEAHRKYIDIQCVLSGQEAIGFVPSAEGLSLVEAYSPEKDIAFFAAPASYASIAMSAGRYAILYPGQGHMPNLHSDGPHEVVKVVVKVSAAWHAARVE